MRAWKVLARAGGKLDVARQIASQLPPGRVRDVTKAGVNVIGLNDAIAWYRPPADFYNVPLRTLIPIVGTAPVGLRRAQWRN